ncbi:PTB domain-containing engulfment adapter protein 1-like [Lytechinus pictus]|uniref:PTB domain-containing engulfment adapter protein 1-like n=1 Tax=Lytechinus pictus TaxID=7653 RepID=UPI00240E2404|nr:PTB domain-containing engulfment adapter protein 1-like [Lytechinus pictus]
MELTISVDGITIQDRQTKEKQFTYPLHHISYCADDKSDKKICAFIAKVSQENRNVCHVMESDKNAEEITLTVGQAFDLAYQKFLSNANKTQEQQEQNDNLRKRVSPSPSHSPRIGRSPAHTPQMGRMYSHGTFRTDSPPSRGATPPGIGTPPRVVTPPTSKQGVSPRITRAPQATPIISVTPDPSIGASLPPPPPDFTDNTTPILHPSPPTPPPPPQGAPPSYITHPTTNPNPTCDTLHNTISPQDQIQNTPHPEEDLHDRPNELYVPGDILTTKL